MTAIETLYERVHGLIDAEGLGWMFAGVWTHMQKRHLRTTSIGCLDEGNEDPVEELNGAKIGLEQM